MTFFCCNFLTTNVLQKSLKNAVEVLAPSVWTLFARILNYCFVFLTCRICCFRCGRFANLFSHFKPIKNPPQDHLFASETSKRLRRQHLGSIFYCFLQGSAHGDVQNIKKTKVPAPRQHFLLFFTRFCAPLSECCNCTARLAVPDPL